MTTIKDLPIDVLSVISNNLEVCDVVNMKVALNHKRFLDLPCKKTIYKSNNIRIDKRYKKYIVFTSMIKYIPEDGIEFNYENTFRRFEGPPMHLDDLRGYYGITINETVRDIPILPEVYEVTSSKCKVDLSNWIHLKKLKFNHTTDIDVNIVSKMTNLESLTLPFNTRSINLQNNIKLHKLSAIFSSININEIYFLCNLEKLNLNDNTVITYIPHFPKLKYLSCDSATNLERIDNLPSLINLVCSNTKIVNIDNLTSLTYLDCCRTKITDLSSLINLKNLICCYSKLATINNPLLIHINCSFSNKITCIDTINNLQSLNCCYSSLLNVNHLVNLTYLDCHHTKIVDAYNLISLKTLICRFTPIQNINMLINLERLDYDKTKITNIYNLSKLKYLHSNIRSL
jgi:hypothetical protein